MNPTYPYILAGDRTPTNTFTMRRGIRVHKKGPIENWLRLKFFVMGVTFLKSNVSVRIDGHRFEPDLVYVDPDRGIYLDIEIDEPYSWRGMPCHYVDNTGKSKDSRRDNLFTSAGWTVIRFSERQMFTRPQSCIGCICRIIASMDGTFLKEHQEMILMPDPPTEPRWTEAQSKLMAKKNSREEYLAFRPGNISVYNFGKFAHSQITKILKGEWMNS